MIKYTKLVRDNIPDILDSKGIVYEKWVAGSIEYKDRLIEKMLEEVQEFAEEGSIEELADIIEVLEALRRLPDYSDVDAIRITKKVEKGGFEKRFIVKREK